MEVLYLKVKIKEVRLTKSKKKLWDLDCFAEGEGTEVGESTQE